METVKLIRQCRKEGRSILTEAESKKVVAEYGLPIVREIVATEAEAAVEAAATLGYPVALKGVGVRLTHKTELGVVKINLTNEGDVRAAFDEIRMKAGDDWEACLIQPMVSGRREFVAGVSRDPQFGPVVMFGLGGILTEALDDVVFGITPLGASQALEMTGAIKSGKLLGAFRGESAVDREQLAEVLTGLSRLAVEHPEIKEVDINPLIVSPDGAVTAVDALVGLAHDYFEDGVPGLGLMAPRTDSQGIRKAIDRMMHPRSIAVVGVARTYKGGFPGMFRCIRDFGYPGRLYPINPKAGEIDGVKAYPDLVSLPEPADLVVISVPGPLVPEALKDCIASGNRQVHIFSSGFKETGEPEGIALQEEIEKIALEGGLHVVGPNCMGIHVPSERLLTWTAASEKSGPVAFVSQSGGHAQDFTHYAAERCGIHFSKVVSYGNALTLDSTDFLDYLAGDDETRIIAMYMEGVKDGPKLLAQITEINRSKPVVMLKGGLTDSGARTVATHTGSLAGGEKIWRAFFRQTGAVSVDSLEEMAEVVLALNCLEPFRGNRAAILGTGGGIGVAAADSCAKVGLSLPPLSADLMQRLREFIPPAGNMIRNPIDAHILLINLDLLGPTLNLLAENDLDMFILSLHLDWLYGLDAGDHIQRIGRYLAQEVRNHIKGKPLVVVLRQYQPNPAIKASRTQLVEILREAGIPVYEGLDRAVSALAKVSGYYAFHS